MPEPIRQIDWDQLVEIYDPGHKTDPAVEYVFGHDVIKTRVPDQPGSTYHWYDSEE